MKIINVVGARPNFMKIAPIVHELKKYSVDQLLVHTGQHYDNNMSEIFFEELGIPKPDINLEVGSGSRDYQIREIKKKFKPILLKEKPDLVIVVGDVNSTIACASAAKKLGIKVAHVEAGLRSFDMNMPEEKNRIETDAISDYLFTTCLDANENLKKQGISEDRIHFVGNVMIDTLYSNLPKADKSDIKNKLGINEDYALVTLHRPSNVDDKEKLNDVINTLIKISRKIKIIFPIHPRTRNNMEKFGIQAEKLQLTEPLGYLDFLKLVKDTKFVITDSGGLQEETTVLGMPCLTLRENTERPITIREGTNRLVGVEDLLLEVDNILNGKIKKNRIPKFWDGKSGERIFGVLVDETNI